MKIILRLLFIFICGFLFSCQTMPEKQVAKMQNYFIEQASGGKIFLKKYGDIQKTYNLVDAQIEKELNALGYSRVQNEKDAQFILSPRYYTESFEYPDPFANKPDEVSLTPERGTALNFTIQVKSNSGKFLISCDTIYKIIPETLNVANIRYQVNRALRFFPKHEVKIEQ